MCLLTYLPAGVTPDLAALRTGTTVNPDGHGYAVVAGDRLLVGKGLDADVVLAEFAKARDAHPNGAALFHSRFRTHGHYDLANCHPFAVGGDRRTVVAHNGILPAAVRPAPTDRRSDTRIAAEQFIPTLGPLHQRRTRLRLQRWMGPNNLMVLLTVDRRYRQNAYVLNEPSGIWQGDIWYSNDGYLPPVWSWSARSAQPEAAGAPWTFRCRGCRSVIDMTEARCPACEDCWACGLPPSACDCWTPEGMGGPA